jgi:hypothetical protein
MMQKERIFEWYAKRHLDFESLPLDAMISRSLKWMVQCELLNQ